MEGGKFIIFIALVAPAFTMSMSGSDLSPASRSTVGTFELISDLKADQNFTRAMAFLKFQPEDLAKILEVKNLTFKLEQLDSDISDYKIFKYSIIGLEKEIKAEFENGIIFSDVAVDGRKLTAMIRVSGRVVNILQFFETSDVTAQIIGIFYPQGCEVTFTASNTRGQQDEFHMSRLHFKRV